MTDAPRIFWDYEAEATLRRDLETGAHVIACTYFLTPWFVEDLFATPLREGGVTILANHRHAVLAADTLNLHNKLTVNTWPKRRMWHAKIVIIYADQITWLLSHNLTAFAFRSARNVATRFTDHETLAAVYTKVNQALLSTQCLKRPLAGERPNQ